jgi:hypothetical protein
MRTGSKRAGLLAAVLLAPAAASAEAPALSGRWRLVESPAPAESGAAPRLPATASSGWGREITITLEAGRVTIERHQFAENDMQPPLRYVYVLGGPESRNLVNMGRGPQEQVARAELKDNALVISSRHAAGTDLAAEVTQVFSIDPEGGLLVETTRAAGGATSATRARYRK